MVPLGFWNGKDSGTVVFLVGQGVPRTSHGPLAAPWGLLPKSRWCAGIHTSHLLGPCKGQHTQQMIHTACLYVCCTLEEVRTNQISFASRPRILADS